MIYLVNQFYVLQHISKNNSEIIFLLHKVILILVDQIINWLTNLKDIEFQSSLIINRMIKIYNFSNLKFSKTFIKLTIIFCLFVSANTYLYAQTAINTSFESSDNYSVANIHNQNKWTVTSGLGAIIASGNYSKTGSQGLKVSSTTTALQTDFIPYSSSTTGLTGDVYVDFWINFKTLPAAPFGITGFDLGTITHRSFLIEFQTSGKIKMYDGSSGWATQPLYTANTWTRITVKIDNASAKCQYAINGIVQNKLFAFREIRNGATTFDFNSIRFSMDAGASDVAVDDVYIGTSPVSGIVFQESSNDRTITLTQPNYGSIVLNPLKTVYQLNDQVTATATIPEHYIFSAWTGDVTGTVNPTTFTVTKNMTVGATVIVDPSNPPAQSTIIVIQPVGGTISLTPQQSIYYDGATVTANLSLQSGYQFVGWSGSLSGTTLSKTFVVNGPMTISASVSEILVSTTTRTVSTVLQFKDALSAMNPGDTVLVLDGTYNIGGLKITRGGSSLKPIIIKSKNLFGAKITGSTYFNTSYQSYVTYEGFEFNVNPGSTIFKMEGCNYVRITRNWFKMIETTDTTQTSKWITIGDLWDSEVCNSHHNRIDHNLFDGKHDQGAWMIIDGSHGTIPAISQHDRIDHNIFRNNTPRVTNEKETIRLGVSDLSHKDAFTVVENNLFEDCDGDPEIVSVKSNCDTIQNNTFRRCLGTISLRQGNNSVVEGNFVFGEGKTAIFSGGTIGCGGVRVYGLNHKIINNYFEGLTGSKWDAACTLTNGDVTNTSTSLSSHFLPENIVFAFNTLVNNNSNIEIGFDNNSSYGKAPINCMIANNIVSASSNPLVKYYSTTSLAGVSFQNNIMYSTGSSTLGLTGTNGTQVKTIDPLLAQSDCRAYGQTCDKKTPVSLYKLTASSPAIDASIGYEFVSKDFEGQPDVGVRDIGADEFNGSSEITNGPLNDQQVGPTAPESYVYEISTSTAVAIVFENQLTAYPNPFLGTTQLNIPTSKEGQATIRIYDTTGKQILKSEIRVNKGNLQYSVNTSSKGILFCTIDLPEKKLTIKLISK